MYNCKNCNKELTKGKTRFCNKSCKEEAKTKNFRPCAVYGKERQYKQSIIDDADCNRLFFCSREHQFNFYKTSKMYAGKNNPMFGIAARTKETHPEWAEKIVKTTRERQINSGDKNGMKQPEARKKVSETRKRKCKEDPEFKESLRQQVVQAHANGKYAHVKLGVCKWYDHIKPDGTLIKLQGTWELKYAKHLQQG